MEFYRMSTGDEGNTATEHFVHLMDRFFDCFNVHDMSESKKTRKPERDPYWSGKDWRFEVMLCMMSMIVTLHSMSSRCVTHVHVYKHSCKLVVREHVAHMQWLQNVFLAFLQEWENEVSQTIQYSTGQRAKMLLSHETMSGLQITGVHILLHYILKICSRLSVYTSVDDYNNAVTIFINTHIVNLHII